MLHTSHDKCFSQDRPAGQHGARKPKERRTPGILSGWAKKTRRATQARDQTVHLLACQGSVTVRSTDAEGRPQHTPRGQTVMENFFAPASAAFRSADVTNWCGTKASMQDSHGQRSSWRPRYLPPEALHESDETAKRVAFRTEQ